MKKTTTLHLPQNQDEKYRHDLRASHAAQQSGERANSEATLTQEDEGMTNQR